MSDRTAIEWADATWNPITGCASCSEGCRWCYAADLAARRLQHHPSRAGLARLLSSGRAVFNGTVRFNEGWLDQPLRWTKPRRIFVCAHSDLFYERVHDDWIDRIHAVMALNPAHRYLTLTKRAKRMHAYYEAAGRFDQIMEAANRLRFEQAGRRFPWPPYSHIDSMMDQVWSGVSAENQSQLESRGHWLRHAAVGMRWLSAEPLLGPLDLKAADCEYLDWVVVGGESGRDPRPMHADWVRSLRDQCAGLGIAFFFKQWGGRTSKAGGRLLDGVEHDAMPVVAGG